jgi:hypothetical protein
MGAPGFFCVPPDHRQHFQDRVTGTHPVILMCKRRPEDGHDPVARDLVERVGMLPRAATLATGVATLKKGGWISFMLSKALLRN